MMIWETFHKAEKYPALIITLNINQILPLRVVLAVPFYQLNHIQGSCYCLKHLKYYPLPENFELVLLTCLTENLGARYHQYWIHVCLLRDL